MKLCIITLLIILNYAHAQPTMVDPYYKRPSVKSSIDLMVPLSKLTAYNVSGDGHSILIRESSYDGIPLTEGEVILDYELPRGVVWSDIKFRVNMHNLYITIPIYFPHFYTIASVSDKGEVVSV